MSKHRYASLGSATLFVGIVASACSEQASSGQAQAGSGGQSTGAGSPSTAGSLGVPPASGGMAGTAGALSPGMGGTRAGSAGQGGAASAGAGSGGKPPYVPPVSSVMCPEPHVGGEATEIADFDEGLGIVEVDGRAGIWFGYSDGTSTQTDSPIPVVDSDLGGKAMHVTGGGFKNWGSGIGSSIAFDFEGNVQCPYDASAFAGVRLKLKGSGSVRLRITQVATTPATATDRKGSCDPNRAVCDGHHEVTIVLTEDWTEHELAWSDFKQAFGQLVDFDPKTMLGLSFEFNSNTTYDVWVDDIEFTQTGAGGAGAGGAGPGGAGAGGADAGGAEG